MKKNNLISSYMKNTIWSDMLQLNLINKDYWVNEFDLLINHLKTDIDKVKSFPTSDKYTYEKLKKCVAFIDFFDVYLGLYTTVKKHRDENNLDYLGEYQEKIRDLKYEIKKDNKIIAKFRTLLKENDSLEKQNLYSSWIENFFLSKKNQNSYVEINSKKILAKIETHVEAFNGNTVLEQSKNKIFISNKDSERLFGLSKLQIKKAKIKNGFLFTVDEKINDYLSVLKDRNMRKDFYMVYNNIKNYQYKSKNNIELTKILKEKQKLAKLLGFDNYLDLVISDYQVSQKDDVFSYLNEIKNNLEIYNKEIFEKIECLAKNDGVTTLESWDYPYYIKKLKQEKNKIIEEYFNYDDFLPKLINKFQKIFSIKINKIDFTSIGNKVDLYEIKDEKTGRIANLMISPFFQKEKFGCSVYDFTRGFKSNLGNIPFVQYMQFNIEKKSGRHQLSFYDVRNILHEFGHFFHIFFENSKDIFNKNLNISWDLIELPSQYLENFIYDYNFIKDLSSHYKTGEKISKLDYENAKNNVTRYLGYSMQKDIKRYFTKLELFEEIKKYSKNNIQKEIEKKVRKNKIIYSCIYDDMLGYVNYKEDYGPTEYIYLYSGQLAYSLFKNKKDINEMFRKGFNYHKKITLNEHLNKNLVYNNVNFIDFLKKV